MFPKFKLYWKDLTTPDRCPSEILFVAGAVGIAVFLLGLMIGAPILARENLEWLLYALSATAIPALAYFYAVRLEHSAALLGLPDLLQVATAFIGIPLVVVGLALRLGLFHPPTSEISVLLAALLIVIWLVIPFLPRFLAGQFGDSLGPIVPWTALAQFGIVLVAGIGILLFAQFPVWAALSAWSLGSAVLIVGLSFGAGERMARFFPAWLIDSLALLVLILILVSFDPPIDRVHHNFYLGPVNDVLQGKVLLVDTFTQYGVLVIHFLAVALGPGPFPLSYAGLGVLLTMLLFVEFGIVYAILRQILGTRLVPFGFVLLLVLINAYGQESYSSAYPSVGPLRFLAPLLLLLFVAIRERLPKYERAMIAAEVALVALTSLWSFETFVYTGATYFGVMLFELMTAKQHRPTVVRILGIVGLSVALHVVFVLLTFGASGELPRWGFYFGLLRLYTFQGFGSLPISPWSPWALIGVVYFLSLLALLTAHRYGSRQGTHVVCSELKLVAGLTAFGIATFSYFIGRSHPNNLHHVAIPAVMLLAYWLGIAIREKARLSILFRFGTMGVCGLVVMLLVLNDAPSLLLKWRFSVLGSTLPSSGAPTLGGQGISFIKDQVGSLRNPEASEPAVTEAVDMIRRFAKDERLVPILMSPDLLTETLLLAGKANVFPLSNPSQDELIADSQNRPDRFGRSLREGDWLFLQNTNALIPLERKYLQRVQQSFELERVEVSAHGIEALRLVKRR